MASATPAVGQDAIATMRTLARAGALDAPVKVSCAGLADRLDVSNQTISRRLQLLEDHAYVTRELASDGQWVTITEDGRRVLRTEYERYRRIFEDAETVELHGEVTGGMGEGKHYITLSGYATQFVDRLGYEPFPGTLNLTLERDSIRRRAQLDTLDPIPIDDWEDENRTYGPASCYPATVESTSGEQYDTAHVIVPERTHHDEDNLELIAPEKLRDVLSLADGDRIGIAIAGADS